MRTFSMASLDFRRPYDTYSLNTVRWPKDMQSHIFCELLFGLYVIWKA